MEERIQALVARINSEFPTDSIWWKGAASEESIACVEAALAVQFPSSFRSFLRLTGGGGIMSFLISSVDLKNPLAVQRGTVYGDTLQYREGSIPQPLPEHLVVVQRCSDDNEPFCLDTARWSAEECPVVLYYHQNIARVEDIAPDFLTFYERYLQPRFQEFAE